LRNGDAGRTQKFNSAYFQAGIVQSENNIYFCTPYQAEVAELVDALDSKSSDSNIVRVRFPPSVLKNPADSVGFFYALMFRCLAKYSLANVR